MSDSDRYDYSRFGSKGASRVGQAVYDILNSPNRVDTRVEDVLESSKAKYTQDMENCVNANLYKYEDPFYVLVISKKEPWAANVVRNFFIARQTKPRGLDMVVEYAHATKTLYKVNKYRGNVEVVWSLPGFEEMKSVLNQPELYDRELVKWITDCFAGNLDKEVILKV